MELKELQQHWDRFGRKDPLWAIVAWPEKKGNKWQLDEFFETGVREIATVVESAEGLNIDLKRRRALDFGCGVGRLTQALANHFDEVVGVDIAPSMVKLARKYNRHGSKCTYHLNETDDLRLFPDKTFDFVYTNIVLQHMLPVYAKSYIREFLRVLVPNGLLIFQLPSERVQERGSETPDFSEAQNAERVDPLARIKAFTKLLIPDGVLELYRDRNIEPVMEMHCTSCEEVRELLHANAAQLLRVTEDEYAGPRYRGFQYAVTKNQ